MRLSFIRHLLLLLFLMLFPMPGMAATVFAPVVPGLNLTAVTAQQVAGQVSAFQLLVTWQSSGVTAIESYDPVTAGMLRAELDSSGSPAGNDFPLVDNTALLIYSTTDATLTLGSVTSCTPLNLAAGFNLTGFACFPTPFLASQFLHSTGPGNVTSISRLDGGSGRWQTAAVDGGTIVGDDFPLVPGEGYIIYSSTAVTGWQPPVPRITSVAPQRLYVNQPVTTVDISGDHFTADSIVLLDGVALVTTYVSAGELKANVPTQASAGSPVLTVKTPDSSQTAGFVVSNSFALPVDPAAFSFTSGSLTIHQEESGGTLTLVIPFPAPAGGVTVVLASSNNAVLTVPASVVIPAGATAASVPLAPLNTGNTSNDVVTVIASQSGWVDGQATVTVKPKPTINLSPPATLTGLTFSYLLTVNLTDTAPAGGLLVSFTATPAGIVSVPASVTVPAGATSAQVTVITTAVGNATIIASSPGLALTGTANAVTVKPIQTVNYGPVSSSSVGVVVEQPFGSGTANITYTPVVSREVGVSVGSAFTVVSPNHGAVGTASLPVTIRGFGLDGVTGISFEPATGIIVQTGTLTVAPDGTAATVLIDIAPDAPVSDRTVVVSTATGSISPTIPSAAIFKVTYIQPQLLSLIPNLALTGSTFTLQVNGTSLTSASSVSFSPPDGISIGNPPSVSPDGTLATLNVAIDPAAAAIPRVVTITTPAGTTSAVASPANTFNVMAPATVGTQYTQYTPLVSPQVGILVQPSVSSATQNVTYSELAAVPVGVTVGSAMTGVTPATAGIGTTGLKVKVSGVGLAAATAISFQPATGITIQAGSFAIEADGNPAVVVDIDPAAPVTTRTVMVALPAGFAPPAASGANQFRVTLPQPEIYSMQPIRAMVGQSMVLNIFGKNLASATAIDFQPGTGISINNPPTVNSDGTLATATISIAANAPTGDRVVTITTPGWTTSTLPSVANTFHVTADAGTTYTPLMSQQVGVQVGTATSPTVLTVSYGPALSAEVGVMVTPAPAPASWDVTYAPVVSREIGVVVGAAVTGMTPAAIEPGRTGIFTLTGVGLDLVTGITVIPSTGISVGVWTPDPGGLSGTVVLTADAATTGTRTIVLQTAGGGLQPGGPHATDLMIGYKPAISSISPTLPTVGTSFTLTINGTYLRGVTKVDIVPSDNLEVDAQPVWTSDGTGEHVTVRVTIGPDASPGDRVVVLTTPYGVTTAVGSPANIITLFKPLASNDAAPTPAHPVVADRALDSGYPLPKPGNKEAGINPEAGMGANVRSLYSALVPPGKECLVPQIPLEMPGCRATLPGAHQAVYQFAGYRGPPAG